MAVGQTSSGNTLTTSVSVASRGLTVAGWFRIIGGGSTLESPFGVGTGSSNSISLTLNNSQVPSVYVNSTTSAMIGEYVLIENGYYFGGFSVDGSGNTLGFISCVNPQNKPGEILYSTTLTAGSFSAPVSLLADVLGNWVNGSVENVSVWTSVLTNIQLQGIMAARSTPPAGAWAYWPLLTASDLTDHSGNGRNLTSAGTVSTAAGIPLVTKPPASATSLNIMCVGDSITFGYPENPPGPGYPENLASIRTADSVANLGHDSNTTLDLIALIPTDVVPLISSTKPNIILFAEGVNDIFDGATATQTWNRYLLYIINAHALGCYCLVGNILPTNQTVNPSDPATMAAFNALLYANHAGADWLADNHADPYFANPANTAVFVDGLHLTAAGYVHLGELNWQGALIAWLVKDSAIFFTTE